MVEAGFISRARIEGLANRVPICLGCDCFFCQPRSIIKSFGTDCGLGVSDCERAGLVMWANGECGDHAYSRQPGEPTYSQEPVRFLAEIHKPRSEIVIHRW